MEAKELRALRHRWVAGAFPTTGRAQAKAALVIDELIHECFALRKSLRRELEGKHCKQASKGGG